MKVKRALARFHSRVDQPEQYYTSHFDEDWRSPCETRIKDSEVIWNPAPQDPSVDFRGVATAAEEPIHPDICEYFGSFWSDHMQADSKEGPVSLIQLWNPEDFDRLVANLMGHLLVKRRAKHEFTVFFANTDPDTELFLSIHNQTGRILLEEPGKPPLREVESDIATFIDRLTPVQRKADIY